jgi:hypothetical protein
MAVFSLIGDLMKTAPKVPKLAKIEPGKEAGEAIEANIANLPKIREMQELSQQLGIDLLGQGIEGLFGQGAMQSIQQNIASGLKGELPRDVQETLERQAAELGQKGGFGGSLFGRNVTLRSLGLSSLARMQQSMDSAQRWLAMGTAGVPSFGAMFTTPQMEIAQANIDRELMFQRNWVENQLKSAHAFNNIMGDFFNTLDQQIIQLGSSALGIFGGGMMGGGAGGGGAGGGAGGGGVMPQMTGLQYMGGFGGGAPSSMPGWDIY